MKVTPEQIEHRLASAKEKLARYEQEAAKHGGMLRRHELWREAYLQFPYLIGAPDERVAERFCDIFLNMTHLTPEAKVGPLPPGQDDGFMEKFTHMLEELSSRGGLTSDVATRATASARRYFANGEPIGVRMFRGYTPPSAPFVVKYGRREFLEPMLNAGRLRICPASYYNASSHNAAVRDDEIHRTFYIPTFHERIKGIDHTYVDGFRLTYDDDDLVLPVVAPDYFLFSLCDSIYYRMPTDFDADAALIIRRPELFAQRLISAFLAHWPDFEPIWGPVTYYDPYRDYAKMKVHEMTKHFGYTYQREVRVVLRAKGTPRQPLQPEFLDIGPMTDYAELVSAA